METERQRASSGSPYEATVGFSRALRHGHHVAVSGTAPIWPDGSVVTDVSSQARRCWEIALEALRELGGRPEDVVRTRHYVVNLDDVEEVAAVHGEVFGEIRPASTIVQVAGLVDPRWKVEIELDAFVGD